MPSEAAAVALVADGVGVKLNEDASLKVWRHAELNRSAQAVGEEGVAASGAPRPWPEWRPSQLDAVLRGLAGRCLQCVEVETACLKPVRPVCSALRRRGPFESSTNTVVVVGARRARRCRD